MQCGASADGLQGLGVAVWKCSGASKISEIPERCGAGLNFAGARRERTKKFNPCKTLLVVGTTKAIGSLFGEQGTLFRQAWPSALARRQAIGSSLWPSTLVRR